METQYRRLRLGTPASRNEHIPRKEMEISIGNNTTNSTSIVATNIFPARGWNPNSQIAQHPILIFSTIATPKNSQPASSWQRQQRAET
jgi:hypothetical protein